jgi:SagB-type dehydrogenase family enzyme
MASLLRAIVFIYFCFSFNNIQAMDIIKLPEPKDKKVVYLDELLNKRYSIRTFKQKPISIDDLSYILWCSYGFKKDGGRVVPSAGALYPLDIYIIAGSIEGERNMGIIPGIYHYLPDKHQIELIKKGDIRKDVANASLSQMWMASAPCMIAITCEYKRITSKYRDRGIRYAHMEAGNVSQNIFLATFNTGLGCGIVGAFNDDLVKTVMGINRMREPLLIMPIGYR